MTDKDLLEHAFINQLETDFDNQEYDAMSEMIQLLLKDEANVKTITEYLSDSAKENLLEGRTAVRTRYRATEAYAIVDHHSNVTGVFKTLADARKEVKAHLNKYYDGYREDFVNPTLVRYFSKSTNYVNDNDFVRKIERIELK